jgi:hypothetical protein
LKVSRIISKSNCKACGGKSIAFKLEKTLTKDILPLLKDKYIVQDHFLLAGILYVENEGIIATGAFGSTTLQTSCKNSECSKYIDQLEGILVGME